MAPRRRVKSRGSAPITRPPSEIERAVALVGSIRGLSRRLHVPASTVRAWVRKGEPSAAGALLVARFLGDRQLEERRRVQEREAFEAMMEMADATFRLPVGRTSEGIRSGRNTQGYRWLLRLEGYLTLSMMDEIAAWVMSKARRYP